MGDFDRNVAPSSGKPNETKKMVMVVALGALLVGLVAMQLMKHGDGPQPAIGAPVTGDVALPPPVVAEEISPEALARMTADLQNDPTKPLLRQNAHDDHSLDAVPANPFNMDNGWLASLIRPSTPVAPATQQAQPVVHVNSNPPPVPGTALRVEDYKLSSIVNGNMAIINGKIVKTNDIVGKARVLQIRDDAVVLQSADTPTGPTVEISTSPRLTSGGN